MTPLERITERVTRNGHPGAKGTPISLLTLEEFFEGNDVVGSIGCNLDGEPPPSQFYELFKSIAAKPQVKDIRVLVIQFDEPEWPFSDQIFVMTDASLEEVASWFPENLRPDEVDEGSFQTSRFEPYEVPEGTRPVVCWWD